MFPISKDFHIDLKAKFPFLINQNINTKNQTLTGYSFRELGWDRCGNQQTTGTPMKTIAKKNLPPKNKKTCVTRQMPVPMLK